MICFTLKSYKYFLVISLLICSSVYASKESKKTCENNKNVTCKEKTTQFNDLMRYWHTFFNDQPYEQELEKLLLQGVDPNTVSLSWQGKPRYPLNILTAHPISNANELTLTIKAKLRQKLNNAGLLLIKYGANTNDPLALYGATRNGYLDIAKRLLRNKNIDIYDDSKKVAFPFLSNLKPIDVIEEEISRLLLLNGATVNLYKKDPEKLKEYVKNARKNSSDQRCYDKNLQHRLLRYSQMPIDGTVRRIQRKQGAPYNIHRAWFNQQSSQKPGHRPLKTRWSKKNVQQHTNTEQKVEKESSAAK